MGDTRPGDPLLPCLSYDLPRIYGTGDVMPWASLGTVFRCTRTVTSVLRISTCFLFMFLLLVASVRLGACLAVPVNTCRLGDGSTVVFRAIGRSSQLPKNKRKLKSSNVRCHSNGSGSCQSGAAAELTHGHSWLRCLPHSCRRPDLFIVAAATSLSSRGIMTKCQTRWLGTKVVANHIPAPMFRRSSCEQRRGEPETPAACKHTRKPASEGRD